MCCQKTIGVTMLSRFALVLLALAAAFTPLHAQKKVDRKALEAAVKEFQRFYSDENKHLRKAAVDDLGACNHPEVIPFLLKALKDKEVIVRRAVEPALAKQVSPEALALLTRTLKKTRDEELQLAILGAFKQSRPKVALDTVLKIAREGSFATRVVAAELLPLLPQDGGRAGDLLLELTRDREPQIRLIAIDGLMALKHKKALDQVIEIMDQDKDWRVKASAIAACASFREKRCIEPLLNVLENGKGRLKEDAHRALLNLTGLRYSNNPKTWRSWWKRARSYFKVPTEEEIQKKRAQIRKAMAAYGAEDKSPPFLGIKTKSQRILFILDVSGSMRDLVVPKGSDPEKLKRFRELYGPGETKIDLSRNQLINTIARLGKHVKFNILLFDSEIRPWKKKLVSASGGNKNMAFKFLGRLTPESIERRVAKDDKGGTNTFAALNWAFGLTKKPQKKPTKNHKVESDTVFFLTDGLPSAGRLIDVNELLRYFRVVNRRAKIVFHTITFGTGNESFLRPMAESSGGRFVAVALD